MSGVLDVRLLPSASTQLHSHPFTSFHRAHRLLGSCALRLLRRRRRRRRRRRPKSACSSPLLRVSALPSAERPESAVRGCLPLSGLAVPVVQLLSPHHRLLFHSSRRAASPDLPSSHPENPPAPSSTSSPSHRSHRGMGRTQPHLCPPTPSTHASLSCSSPAACAD